MSARPIIFHIDVNSAFLSWSAAYRCHVLGEEPDLRTVPSIVGGDQEARHGIVLAKSTPAKKYGIQTGEPDSGSPEEMPEPDHYPSGFPSVCGKFEGSDIVAEKLFRPCGPVQH